MEPARAADLSAVWRACLEQALEAFRNGSLPIGAVITDADGEVLAVGRNRLAEQHPQTPHLPGTPYLTGTPLAHAEVNALLQLGYRRPGPRPILYTTTEPCPLCMGAARMAGVGRVVYASRDPWAGAASMAESVPYLKRVGPAVAGPIPELEEPLMAWLLAAHGGGGGRSSPFVEAWKDKYPRAVAAADSLRGSTGLAAAAARGVDDLWEALVSELGAQ